MRYIAKKLKDGSYELIAIGKRQTPKGKEVEVIEGKIQNPIDKEALKKVIEQFDEETEFFINQEEENHKRWLENFKKQREFDYKELKAELEAIEKLGK